MQVGQVRVLDVRVHLLQVVPEVHRSIGSVVTLGAVVHLHTLMLARVEDVLPNVLSTV